MAGGFGFSFGKIIQVMHVYVIYKSITIGSGKIAF